MSVLKCQGKKASEKTTIKNDRTEKLTKKVCIRKSSRSKSPYRTASWKSVRECYLQKWQFWKTSQNFIHKNSGSKCPYRNSSWKSVPKKLPLKWPSRNASQNMIRKNSGSKCPSRNAAVRKQLSLKMNALKCSQNCIRKNNCSKFPFWNASWNSSAKTTIKNDSTESLPKTLSSKTVVQIVRPEMLAEKASEKTKMMYWNADQNCIHKTRCSNCPYRNDSWLKKLSMKMTVLKCCTKCIRKKVVQNDRTEILAELPFKKLSLKMTVQKWCCQKLYPQKQLLKSSVSKC